MDTDIIQQKPTIFDICRPRDVLFHLSRDVKADKRSPAPACRPRARHCSPTIPRWHFHPTCVTNLFISRPNARSIMVSAVPIRPYPCPAVTHKADLAPHSVVPLAREAQHLLPCAARKRLKRHLARGGEKMWGRMTRGDARLRARIVRDLRSVKSLGGEVVEELAWRK